MFKRKILFCFVAILGFVFCGSSAVLSAQNQKTAAQAQAKKCSQLQSRCSSITTRNATVAPREFWGLISAGAMDYKRVYQAGAGSVRGYVYIEGAGHKSSYDWSVQDNYFKSVFASGLSMVPVICNDSSNGIYYAGPNDKNWPLYQDYLRQVVARYGPKGIFWKLNPGLPYKPITTWEICNEPNLKYFVPGRVYNEASFVSYSKYLIGASKEIKTIDPSAKVLVGGLANIQTAKVPKGIPGTEFLSKLYKYPGARKAFDGVAFHPYDKDAKAVATSIQAVRSVMDRAGDKTKSIYITEIGWATGGGDKTMSVSQKQQATNLTESFTWLKNNRLKLKINSVYWYSWTDLMTPTVNPGVLQWDAFSGLFDAAGKPKLSWYAFLKMTGGK